MPPGISGTLFLHSMPGREEPLQAAWAEASRQEIKGIVCLTGSHEIRAKSPDYATAMDTGSVPFEMLCCEIPDYETPSDREAFCKLVFKVATRVKNGDSMLIHCGAGIGRTGMFATAVLMAMGLSQKQAAEEVSKAGSGAETDGQNAFLSLCAPLLHPPTASY